MEFMERDESGSGRNQDGSGQEERRLSIEPQPMSDAEGDWTHRSESSVLDDDEDQGVADEEKNRGYQKNDRLDMIPEKRHPLD